MNTFFLNVIKLPYRIMQIVILLILSTCVSTESLPTAEPKRIPTSANSSSSDEGIKIQKVVSLSGRTRLYHDSLYVFNTSDFLSLDETSKKVNVNMILPEEWEIRYGVITNQDGFKIGELSPGVFAPSLNFYDTFPKVGMIRTTSDTKIKILSKDWITVGSYKVLKLTETGMIYGGFTEPEQIIFDRYYITMKNNSFGFVIYNNIIDRFEDSIIYNIIESLEISE